MLHIILAVLGLIMASALGVVIVSQVTLQAKVRNQEENFRRLDLAAESLEASLVRMPGVSAAFAPAPAGGFEWSTLPGGIGVVNATVDGDPFLYCPIAPDMSEDQRAALFGTELNGPSAGTVQGAASGDEYAIGVKNGLVVASALVIDADVKSALQPVAFLVAPGMTADSPPSCKSVRLDAHSGKAIAPGGVVRVVSAAVGSASSVESGSAEFWVSASGTGDGLGSSTPTTIDAALHHYLAHLPAEITFKVRGSVSPSAGLWSQFMLSSAAAKAAIRFEGVDGAAQVSAPASDSWAVANRLTLSNINVAAPALQVLSGGRLDLRGSTFVASGLGPAASVTLAPMSELVLSSSTIGSAFNRASGTGIRDLGASQVGADAMSSVFASSSNICWLSESLGVAFTWSHNGTGSRSSVRSETEFPAPEAGADPTVVQAYEQEVLTRAASRRVNSSNLACQ